jgi:hypothetical protein
MLIPGIILLKDLFSVPIRLEYGFRFACGPDYAERQEVGFRDATVERVPRQLGGRFIVIHQSLILNLVSLCFLISIPSQATAQEDEAQAIVISERVGTEIDHEERNAFRLFLDVEGFESAAFFKMPDGSYMLKITVTDKVNGEERIQWIPRTELEVNQIGEYVDHFEQILSGEYQLRNEHELVQISEPEKPILSGTPPLNSGRIVAELLNGSLGAFLGGALGFFVASGESFEEHGAPAVFLGAVSLGSAAGVYLVGTAGRETGSICTTAIGSLMGSLAVLLLPESTETAGLFILPPIGATVGFNITRRYETPRPTGTALLNLSRGGPKVAIPVTYLRSGISNRGSLMPALDLITVEL